MTHGKTYNKSPRRINHKATKSKTNTGTTALERSVEQTTEGFKALLQLANFTLGPDATLNTEIHKNSIRIKALNSVNASKRKHKNQINHYNKQRRVLMANSTICQSKWNMQVWSESIQENLGSWDICFKQATPTLTQTGSAPNQMSPPFGGGHNNRSQCTLFDYRTD